VAASIASANAESKEVKDSPVKHLVQIRLPQDFMMNVINGNGQMPMGP